MSQGYETIMSHPLLLESMFPCSLMYESRLCDILLKPRPLDLWCLTFVSIALSAIATTRFKNTVPFVLIWIPISWAPTSLHLTQDIKNFQQAFHPSHCLPQTFRSQLMEFFLTRCLIRNRNNNVSLVVYHSILTWISHASAPAFLVSFMSTSGLLGFT